MKTIKSIITVVFIMSVFSACHVQQFAVNTTVQPFEDSGRIFGIKTKGKEFKKSGELFVVGINVMQTDTKRMAEELHAPSYTIESKYNFPSFTLEALSYGLIDYRMVKVIKRDN